MVQAPSPLPTAGTVRRYHASASSVLRARLTGPARILAPRAIFDGAIHLGDPDDSDVEVALVAPDAVVHPHAVVLSPTCSAWPFDDLHLGSEVSVGGREIRSGTTVVQVTRWWSPTPVVGSVERERLLASARLVHGELVLRSAPLPPEIGARFSDLIESVQVGDGTAAEAATLRLLGLGAGSTPTGDDLLAGLVAGIDRFAGSLQPSPATPVLAANRRVVDAVLEHRHAATTALSAALLGHATRGEVCRPASRLIVTMARGLEGHTLRAALDGLLAVGSTSGRDLTLGLLAAVEALTDPEPPIVRDALTGPGTFARPDALTHLDVRDAAVVPTTSANTPGRP